MAYDSLLDLVRQWMIIRFALSTDRDLWAWIFVIGAAAHLKYLAVAVLWVADQKPTPFEQYQPKRTLGQAVRLIREKNLLDPATVERLEGIAELRNSVAHRGATYGVPFRKGDPSRGEYKGRSVDSMFERFRMLSRPSVPHQTAQKATPADPEWHLQPQLCSPPPPVSAEKSAHHLRLQKDRSANFNASCLPVEKKLFGLSCVILNLLLYALRLEPYVGMFLPFLFVRLEDLVHSYITRHTIR
jgi:hypothetical protein